MLRLVYDTNNRSVRDLVASITRKEKPPFQPFAHTTTIAVVQAILLLNLRIVANV